MYQINQLILIKMTQNQRIMNKMMMMKRKMRTRIRNRQIFIVYLEQQAPCSLDPTSWIKILSKASSYHH